MINAIYSNLCPVCHGDLGVEEIEKKRCKKKNLELEKVYEIPELEAFSQFFSSRVGELRALQKLWAKRVLSKESFIVNTYSTEIEAGAGVASIWILI